MGDRADFGPWAERSHGNGGQGPVRIISYPTSTALALDMKLGLPVARQPQRLVS